MKEITEVRVLRDQIIEFDIKYKKLELEYHNCSRSLHAAEEMIKSDPNLLVAKESWISFKTLNDEMRMLQLSYDNLKRDFINLQAQTSDLRSDVDRKSCMIDRLLEKQTQPPTTKAEGEIKLKVSNSVTSEEYEELKKKYELICDQLSVEKAKNESLTRVLDCSEDRVRMAECSLIVITKELGLLRAGFSEQQIKYDELQMLTHSLQTQKDVLQAEVDVLKKQKHRLSSSITSLRNESIILQDEISDLKEDLLVCTETLSLKSSQVTQLEIELKVSDKNLRSYETKS